MITDRLSVRPTFDHCYRSIARDAVYQGLADRGFCLNPVHVRHPGRKVCQFLHFFSPSGAMVYLEFIFRDLNLPASDHEPEEPLQHAGFSLKVNGDLKGVAEEFRRTFPHWLPTFKHRNYQWMKDDVSTLPGWNFLTFENPPVPDVHVWLTEYEPLPDWTAEQRMKRREEIEVMSQHSNGARRILGFLWNGSTLEQLTTLSNICSTDLNDSCLELEGGTKIIGLPGGHPLQPVFKDKKSNLWAVVLGVESIDQFIARSRPDEILDIDGKKAALIKIDDNSWDILAIERTNL